ncbi:MAG TPA: GAF domain-containing protein [Capsulimonadaceae bacterium]
MSQPDSSMLEQIHNLSRVTVDVSDWRELLQAVLEEAAQFIGADRSFLALVNEDTGELHIHSVTGDGWTEERRAQRLKIAATGDTGWKDALHGSRRNSRGITGHVAETGKTHLAGDVREDPYYYAFFSDVCSEIAVAMVDDNGLTRGVLNLQSLKYNHFTDRHVRYLETVANFTVMRLMIARIQARQTALIELGKDLSAITDTATLMRRVVDVAADILRFEDCSLFALDPERKELILRATRGPLEHQVGVAAYPVGEGLTGWVAQHGESVRTASPAGDPRHSGRYQEVPSGEIGAFLAVPIYGRSKVLGVLRVMRRRSNAPWFRSEFTDDDENVLVTIASQLGAALESNRMIDRLMATERMAAWGEMSAKAAHMIGNRTFAIKGDLNELEYVLSEADDKRPRFRELAEAIRRGIFRLEEILQEFRDFVRATQISLSEESINEILTQCVAESFPRRSNVALHLDLTDGLPVLPADPSRLKRAFSELIENAVSYMPDGGELTIKTSKAESIEAQQLCGLTRSRSYVRIEFADSGPGVPDSEKPKIFTPFFTSRAKGMGLGLSIVKGILEAHHGNIVEIGLAGQGAKFVAFLPVKP